MSFTEVLAELPGLTVAERQMLVRHAMKLDEPALSPEDESLVESRLANHHNHPGSGVSAEVMKNRVRSQFVP